MAVVGTLMYQDDNPAIAVGMARGWKIGFGYANKGTVVTVYVVTVNNGTQTNATEIPKLANGKADVSAITAYLNGFGVVLAQAVKNVIGA
jgi:hypothetical protein